MRARRTASIAAIALLGALLGIAAAPLGAVVPRGEVFRLDVAPACSERNPDAAPLPGGFVAVWTADDRAWARVFDSGGAPATAEIPVDSGAPLAEGTEATVAAVAASPDGTFLVVWHDTGGDRVVSRLFSPSGVAQGEEAVLFAGIANGELDVTAVPGGGFAVVTTNRSWALLRLLDADGEPSTGVIEVEGYFDHLLVHEPVIAAQPDGDLVLAWHVRNEIRVDPTSGMDHMIIPAATAEDRFTWRKLELGTVPVGWHTGLTLGTDAAGNIVLAWRFATAKGEPPSNLLVQRFDPAGRFFGSPVQVAAGPWAGLGAPALLVEPAGGFVLAWEGIPAGTAASGTALYVQTFDQIATPQANPIEIAGAGAANREEPVLVPAAGGDAFALWRQGRSEEPGVCFSAGIAARRLTPGCQAAPGRLCLGDGRFQLEATWTAPGTGSGSGQGNAVRVTRDTGYFWFFDAENVELMVKVLDGRAVNGKFWVFYGALSNVAWQLRVTDLTTGAVKTYTNPRNQLASRGDTDALPGADALPGDAASGADAFEARPFEVLSLDAPAPAGAASHTPGEELLGPCTEPVQVLPIPTRPGLCLNGRRFEVEVTWHDPFNGGQGTGRGVPLTDDSGYFWFFDPANVELVVKALDGRAVNGKFWFFYGALTNVEYDIRVRHFSGDEKTYHNPPFQFLSRADTAAFTPTSCPCLPVNVPVCGKDGVTYQNECQARCVGYVEVARAGAC